MLAGRIFQNGTREVSDMSRARVTFQGLLVRFAHIRLHLTWAQCSATPCSALTYNESECVRLISISGSVSKRHLISDGYDGRGFEIDLPDLTT